MLFTSLLVAVLPLLRATSAAPSLPVPKLRVDVTGPATVSDVKDLWMTTIVTNKGDASIKLLDHPVSPLNGIQTDIFDVTRECGKRPQFIGYRVYSEVSAANDFIVLNPGDSYMVTHDLSEAYDFAATGAGMYEVQVKPSLTYYHIDPSSDALASITSASITHGGRHLMYISGNLARAHKLSNSTRSIGPPVKIGYSCSREEFRAIITEDWPEAWRMINSAVRALSEDPIGKSDEFRKWFGDGGKPARDTVYEHFQLMAEHATYDHSDILCSNWPTADTCENYLDDKKKTVLAFTTPSSTGQHTLCNLFFKQPAWSLSKPARIPTIVHEISHLLINGGTNSYKDADGVMRVGPETYGVDACEKLAKYPLKAIDNADSHALYAADVWPNPPSRSLPPWVPPKDFAQIVFG